MSASATETTSDVCCVVVIGCANANDWENAMTRVLMTHRQCERRECGAHLTLPVAVRLAVHCIEHLHPQRMMGYGVERYSVSDRPTLLPLQAAQRRQQSMTSGVVVL